MSRRVSPTLIGAFVVSAVVLGVTAFLLLGDVGLFQDREKVAMYFTGSVEGLNKGAPVNVRGVKVGTVIDIDIAIDPLSGELLIPVTVQFEPGAVDYVRTIELPDPDLDRLKFLIEELGLRAQLQLESLLTSQMAIELDYHPDTDIHYRGGGDLPEIPTIPMRFEQFNKHLQNLPLEQILADITSTLASINRIVSSPEILATITSLQQTMTTVDELASNINHNLQPLADTTRETLVSIDELAKNINRDLPALADNTKTALQDAQQALRRVEALLQEDSSQIYNLNSALEEIVAAARSIRMFAETIERQPETLLRGKNPQD